MVVSEPLPALASLETTRLALRAPRASDLDAMFELHADPVANRCSPTGPLSSRADSQVLLHQWLDHWQAHNFGHWAIASRERPDAVLGFGGLMHRCIGDMAGLYLYFRFRPHCWGQGLASEMTLKALEMAFDVLHKSQAMAVVRPTNTPSRKTLERMGMLIKGSLADMPGQAPSLVYEMTAARFASLPKTPVEPTPFGA